VNPKNPKIISLPTLLFVMAVVCINGCAWFEASLAPIRLTPQEVADVVEALEKQKNNVHTLWSTGTLTLDSQGAQSEAEVLMVARRDPSSIRVEITHQWGKPLLHIQVNGSHVDVVSFAGKRRYQGRLGTPWTLRQIPFPLDPDLIWSLVRAYPILPPYHRAQSLKDNQVTLLDEHGADVRVIDLTPDRRPQRIRQCQQGTVLSFFDYEECSGLLYAEEIQWVDREKTTLLTLHVRQMTFNQPVPDALFRQEPPAGFESVQM